MLINLNQELTILEVSGVDAVTYLQGQLTNDIKELSQKPYQLSAHLNNKGRIIATFIITLIQPDTYYLITTKNIADKVLPRLKMFVLRSKVTIIQKEINLYLSDSEIDSAINLHVNNKIIAITDRTYDSSYDETTWKEFLITSPLPLIYIESTEKIIPQQVNWELLGGVNFKKGCYTGQEIVARTHYLGKVKRRLVKFITDGTPQIGQQLVSPALDNQEVGFVVDYYHTGSQYIGLASLQLNCIENTYLDIENNHKLNCSSFIESDI